MEGLVSGLRAFMYHISYLLPLCTTSNSDSSPQATPAPRRCRRRTSTFGTATARGSFWTAMVRDATCRAAYVGRRATALALAQAVALLAQVLVSVNPRPTPHAQASDTAKKATWGLCTASSGGTLARRTLLCTRTTRESRAMPVRRLRRGARCSACDHNATLLPASPPPPVYGDAAAARGWTSSRRWCKSCAPTPRTAGSSCPPGTPLRCVRWRCRRATCLRSSTSRTAS
jgi:hypothetical protein